MKTIPDKYKNRATLRIADVKDILDISRSKAYALAQENAFPAKKLGHTVRIPTVAFFNWLNESTNTNKKVS
jgi:predicted DNA-binding transcriptional regulator AlpA